jgi:hypothetical protein
VVVFAEQHEGAIRALPLSPTLDHFSPLRQPDDPLHANDEVATTNEAAPAL